MPEMLKNDWRGVPRGSAARPAWGTRFRRQTANLVANTLLLGAAALVLVPLAAILGYLLFRGVAGLNWALLTHIPSPEGEPGGGLANGIVGSLLLLFGASLAGVPLGIGAGVFVAERARNGWAAWISFTADVLNGVPSIVVGLVVYALVVVRQRHFSLLAGSVALAIMMIPIVTRATEEALRMVPRGVREAALALGLPPWRITLSVMLRTALPGVLTGVMLALARVAGETAPLLFTAFGNQFWSLSPSQPIAALPLQIYVYATSPFDDWHRQAWSGALVLIVLVIGAMAAVRYYSRRGAYAVTN